MSEPTVDYEAIVIGAGFAGMYALHALRKHNFSAHVLEAGSQVGGTWYWNRYPGARCDVESINYAYTFDLSLMEEWEWTERYATQPEILRYAQWVADRLDLGRDISFNAKVVSAVYDERAATWTVTTATGEQLSCHYVITAVGCLSSAQVPNFDGLDTFAGKLHHTGNWPHEPVSFEGKRVAVIGTGSSGIQAIPEIAKQAAHLTVFQRTPNYSLPARNRPQTEEERRVVKVDSAGIRERILSSPAGFIYPMPERKVGDIAEDELERTLEEYWQLGGTRFLFSFSDIAFDLDANLPAADFVRRKIAQMVQDPSVAKKLTPVTYPIGAKRLCVDTDYYETFNLDHVELVDLHEEPLVTFTPTGISTTAGSRDFDAVVLATGYDAMTGSLTRLGIRGRGGRTLSEKWSEGPKTNLGVSTHGFPNLFMITGPGSPSVLANVIAAIEQHVEWIVEFMEHARKQDIVEIEAESDAEEEWVATVNGIADLTLYPHANSWYLGSNIEGKPRVFMPYPGGMTAYRQACDGVASSGYKGFALASTTAKRISSTTNRMGSQDDGNI